MTPLKTGRFSLQYAFKILLGLTLFGILVFYGTFQARLLITGPQIFLQESQQITASNDRVITIEGEAKNITAITLNGRNIHTTETGHFKETLVLQNGYTIMTLHAEDRYGRTTTVTRGFVLKPQPST